MAAGGVKANTPPPSSAVIKNEYSYTFTSPHNFMACTRTALRFSRKLTLFEKKVKKICEPERDEISLCIRFVTYACNIELLS